MQQTAISQLPNLPPSKRSEKRVLKQAQVNEELWKAVEKEASKDKYTDREVFEYGLKAFLLAKNPKEAARLGIVKLEEK